MITGNWLRGVTSLEIQLRWYEQYSYSCRANWRFLGIDKSVSDEQLQDRVIDIVSQCVFPAAPSWQLMEFHGELKCTVSVQVEVKLRRIPILLQEEIMELHQSKKNWRDGSPSTQRYGETHYKPQRTSPALQQPAVFCVLSKRYCYCWGVSTKFPQNQTFLSTKTAKTSTLLKKGWRNCS